MKNNFVNIWRSFLSVSLPLPASVKGHHVDIIEWGTNKDHYRVGDAVTAFIKIKNTGEKDIKDANAKVLVKRKTVFGEIKVHEGDYKVSDYIKGLRIKPGETKELIFPPGSMPQFLIPDVPLIEGKYRFEIKITIDGNEMGKLERSILISK
ncbi:hypothetical protein CUJ83_12730 [Methanocella sp. CWC-04]|uniref:Uncharacterized protein n=2 Tax=Methanooceanicella nereidis TaxID=2052831 RepID=A0AAP2RDX3_9EURY|nr:hypothetical protein [Methanocella sp. CWC-04]